MPAVVKRELRLDGLDCADCAAGIEKTVARLDGVGSAVLNFATKTLTIEADGRAAMDAIVADAGRIVKKYEPDVKIREIDPLGEPGGHNDTGHADGGMGRGAVIRYGLGAALFLVGVVFRFPRPVSFGIFFVSWLLAGGEILWKALRNVRRGRIFDENFLMSLATVGAFAIGEFPEGAAVMLFYRVGEFFQSRAVDKARRSIAELMDIRPDFARLKTGAATRRVSPQDVKIGDVILVRPGEKIPLDGMVLEGRSMLDTAALSGESVPREVWQGSEVLSGSININGLLTIRVTKAFGESTVSKILELVKNAAGKKAPTESFITKFARYYTPAVVLTAALIAFIPPLALQGALFSDWVHRALVFLVVSCPCALVISIPLGFFGGIGGASARGILIKGGNYLEALNRVDTVVFDKTGTLTKGVFKVTKLAAADGDGEALLKWAAHGESHSNHPVAESIIGAYGGPVDKEAVSAFAEMPGLGVEATVFGKPVVAGNAGLMARHGIGAPPAEDAGTVVHVAVDGAYLGHIVISDEIRRDSRRAVDALRELGVRRIAMLTGDNRAAAEKTGRALGIGEVYAGLLPHQKVEVLERLHGDVPSGGKLVFVGDGINDAPVLARADIGVAMGGVGSDAAIEAADVVIMTDEISRLATAIRIAGRTRAIVWQNIVFALAVKAAVLALGAFGIAAIWAAVFADVGVAIIAVLNALRVLRTEKA